jgi:hypothetical protein
MPNPHKFVSNSPDDPLALVVHCEKAGECTLTAEECSRKEPHYRNSFCNISRVCLYVSAEIVCVAVPGEEPSDGS